MSPQLEMTGNAIEAKLLINVLEEKAKWMPNDTYMRYPGKNWETEGYLTISWKEYANSIDKMAYWLDNQLGKATKNDTIAYFGPSDPRYGILVPAAYKTGRKLLVLDGRVTKDGLRSLTTATACKTWIYAEDDAGGPLLGPADGLQTLALPSLGWILNSDEQGQKRYPYDKTFADAAFEVICVIHTSGTTGEPFYILALGSSAELSQRHWPRGIVNEGWAGQRSLDPCPPQWLAGLHSIICSPVFMNGTCTMLPPDATGLSPELFKKIMAMNPVEGLNCPPHTVATLYADPESRALLKSLKSIMFMGAALDRALGDALCPYTKITPLIGSTEFGEYRSIRPVDRKLWYTHDFVPETSYTMTRVESEKEMSSEVYELVLERPSNTEDYYFQAAYYNPDFLGFDRIETKDLFTPSPIKDTDGRTRWVYAGRKDDLTKLNWLAKFHAQDIEERIQQHPDVEGVCVGGQGRSAPWVIVEAKQDALADQEEVRWLDWFYKSVIADANKAGIDEVRIPRETVLIAKREKPLTRNLKQVVQRKQVEKVYEEEIEHAYLRFEKVLASATPSK